MNRPERFNRATLAPDTQSEGLLCIGVGYQVLAGFSVDCRSPLAIFKNEIGCRPSRFALQNAP
jgi:hypothetical protein